MPPAAAAMAMGSQQQVPASGTIKSIASPQELPAIENHHLFHNYRHHQNENQFEQKQSKREELESLYTQPLDVTAGRDSTSAASARSKSTTLDSGFQTSWPGECSPASFSISASPSASSSGDAAELAASPMRASETMAIIERAPDSASSILSKLTTRVRGRSLTSTRERRHASRPSGESAVTTAAPEQLEQVLVEDNSRSRWCAGRESNIKQASASAAVSSKVQLPTDPSRRRGFSLNRSFSFHRQAPANSGNRREEPSHENRTPPAREVGGNSTRNGTGANAAQLQATGKQIDANLLYANVEPNRRGGAVHLSESNELRNLVAPNCSNNGDANNSNKNLSSLFRSKSMRAVSQPSRWIGNGSADLKRTVNYHCDNHYQHHRHCHHQHHNNQHDANCAGYDATVSTWKSNNQQQASIDYLAGAQVHHKRSFSIRRNSLLAFGKDELGGGAGKIAMFLRKLFSLRRTSRRPQCDDFNPGQQQQQPQDRDQHNDERHLHHHHRLVKVDIVHHLHRERANEATPNYCPKNGSNGDQCRATGCQCTEDDNSNNTNNKRLFSAASSLHDIVGDIETGDNGTGQCQRQAATDDAGQEGGGNECSPGGGRRRQQRRRFDFAPSSPSTVSDNSSSSPSNSLIEILDCSPSLEESRRHLRQVDVQRSPGATRATWQLVKRSESNLSQHSNVSNSTNKSTVSQQLRRHLDEAYKRSNNGNNKSAVSKREREFIDSINVLRQASRHASLENSRSSSKNRQVSQKSSPTSTEQNSTKNSTPMIESSTNTSDDSSCSVISGGASHDHWPSQSLATVGQQQQQLRLSHDEDLTSWTLNEQQLSPTTEICEKQQPLQASPHEHKHLDVPNNNNNVPLPAASSCCCLYASALSCLSQHQHQQYPSRATNQGTDLCQLACCLSSPPPPPPPCCFGHGEQLAFNPPGQCQHQKSAAGNGLLLSEAGDLCCPIWRSLIYSYCQHQPLPSLLQSVPPPPPPPPTTSMPMVQLTDLLDHHHQQASQKTFTPLLHQFQPIELQQQQQQRQTELRHTYTSSSLTNLQQQQQHNTTIDLKIEIGADFKKKLARNGGGGTTGGGGRSTRIKERQQQPQLASTAATMTSDHCGVTSDSLDSSSSSSQDDESMATTDDSLVNSSSSSSSASSSSSSSTSSTKARQCKRATAMVNSKLSGGNYSDSVHLRNLEEDSSRAATATVQLIGNDDDDQTKVVPAQQLVGGPAGLRATTP